MDKAGLGLVIVSLSCLAGTARAADAIPFFKADPKPLMYGRVPLFVPEPKPVMYGPVLPDPAAPECGIDDQACLDRHDGRVLSLASSSHTRQECAQSTHPERCYDRYDMMEGDFVPAPDPIVADPCAWVVLVDHNVATVSSKKLGITKRILNHGWKARTFVGACNVNSVVPVQPATAIPMPAWTVRRGEPVPATPARPDATGVPGVVNAGSRSYVPVVTAAPASSTSKLPATSAPAASAATVSPASNVPARSPTAASARTTSPAPTSATAASARTTSPASTVPPPGAPAATARTTSPASSVPAPGATATAPGTASPTSKPVARAPGASAGMVPPASKPVPARPDAVAGLVPVAMRPAPAVQAPPAPSRPPVASATPPAPPVPSSGAAPSSPLTPTTPAVAAPTGAPGTTQPPPFARPPAVSDAQTGPPAPSR